MNKAELIRVNLKELSETCSLNEITVKSLCKKCGINRQTFYYHYSDINDVIMSYFLNEKIEGIDQANDWPNLIHVILLYSNKNRQLILKTLKSSANNIIEKFFYDNLFRKGKKFIEEKYGNILEKNDINEVAKLMSDSLAREICRMLMNPSELSIPSIEENISKTFDGVMDLICENKKNKKGRK